MCMSPFSAEREKTLCQPETFEPTLALGGVHATKPIMGHSGNLTGATSQLPGKSLAVAEEVSNDPELVPPRHVPQILKWRPKVAAPRLGPRCPSKSCLCAARRG